MLSARQSDAFTSPSQPFEVPKTQLSGDRNRIMQTQKKHKPLIYRQIRKRLKIGVFATKKYFVGNIAAI
ncbi:hypothetical protein C3V39_07200 [Prevotella sp. oral taxon 820]|nr:hypothetical protein C3V39_07200 [Prevotella sp. oral taxon 820]